MGHCTIAIKISLHGYTRSKIAERIVLLLLWRLFLFFLNHAFLFAFSGFLIISSCAKTSYAKYKLNAKLFLYSHGFTTVKDEYIDYNKVFDAFISFSYKDDEFVIREVITGKMIKNISWMEYFKNIVIKSHLIRINNN